MRWIVGAAAALVFLSSCASDRIDPDNSRHRELAQSYLLDNRLQDCRDQLDLALALVPDDQRVLFLKATLDFVNGDLAAARQTWTDLTRVVDDERLRSRVETGLAFTALAQGDLTSAERHLTIALDLDSLNRTALETLKATQRIEKRQQPIAVGSDLIESNAIRDLVSGI